MSNKELRIRLVASLLKEMGVREDEIVSVFRKPAMAETIETATAENLYWITLWHVNRAYKPADKDK